MTKKISLLFLFFALGLVLAGCQKKTAPPEAPINQARAAGNLEQTATSSADLKPEDESALLTALAVRDKLNDISKYQLHDAEVQGNYARGRFSINNDLQADLFWAAKTAGIWHLVFVGQGPDCAKLAGFPAGLEAGCSVDFNNTQISNFDDCLKAGFQATADMPRHCSDSKGDVFVEVLAGGIVKRYISQEVNKCRGLDYECTDAEKPFLDDIGCGCQKIN